MRIGRARTRRRVRPEPDAGHRAGRRGVDRHRDVAVGLGDLVAALDAVALLDEGTGRLAGVLAEGQHDLVGNGIRRTGQRAPSASLRSGGWTPCRKRAERIVEGPSIMVVPALV